ncbi:tryptophan synthase, beta subunit [Helicobacter bilis ATCC 43879]|uniref:Tryptophan synthase beta chain n=1 Tax=Helicobacter bilis ATCC 43879 TaxID=613026 RepID=C3XIY0_9HELI|nr:tryptophan synthase, beta subunit [Helicobacter bilis ATCC 43879]
MDNRIFLKSEKGYFGEGDFRFGGCFIPEILYPALNDLQKAYKQIFQTKGFQKELKRLLKTFVGRPTPLIYAKNASEILGNEIYLKFEGLANTGAHKINNALAQVLLAKRMKKTHIIAETGAGQHGVAVASVCAFLKMPCTIFMGATDIQRQRPNVFIMEQFGAEVVAVESGTKTLKDAVNEALRQWSKVPHEYFYVLGSALGPYPYPDIVRDSQSIIGKEIKKQIKKALSKYLNTFLPDYVVACVGGGSNSMGAFSAFLEDMEVKLVGVEAGGDDFKANKHAMRLAENSGASIGIAHGYRSYFLQDKHGQISNTHSISAGLDYAGVGPQLAHLKHIGRVEFMAASDDSALEALQFFARHEGILPALESSHALAGVLEIAKKEKNKIIVVNVSGRGDKDIFITAKALCTNAWRDFLESELQSVEKLLKQKNKPKEVVVQEEKDEEESKQRQNELKLALQDISHEDMSFFDSTNTENDDTKAQDTQHLTSAQVDSTIQMKDDKSLHKLDTQDLSSMTLDSISEQSLEKLDSMLSNQGVESRADSENLESKAACHTSLNTQNDKTLDSTDSTESATTEAIENLESTNCHINLEQSEKEISSIDLESESKEFLENDENLESNLTNTIDNTEINDTETIQDILKQSETEQENNNLQTESIEDNLQDSQDSIESSEIENVADLIDTDSLNLNESDMESSHKEPLHFLTTDSNIETDLLEITPSSKDTQEAHMQALRFLQGNDLQDSDTQDNDDLQDESDLQLDIISQIDTEQEIISKEDSINPISEFSQETSDNTESLESSEISNEAEILSQDTEANLQGLIETDDTDSLEMPTNANISQDTDISLESLLNEDSNIAPNDDTQNLQDDVEQENIDSKNSMDSSEELAQQLLLDLQAMHESAPEALEDLQHLSTQYRQEDSTDELTQEPAETDTTNDELGLNDIENIESSTIEKCKNATETSDTQESILNTDITDNMQEDELELAKDISLDNVSTENTQQIDTHESPININAFDEMLGLENLDSTNETTQDSGILDSLLNAEMISQDDLNIDLMTSEDSVSPLMQTNDLDLDSNETNGADDIQANFDLEESNLQIDTFAQDSTQDNSVELDEHKESTQEHVKIQDSMTDENITTDTLESNPFHSTQDDDMASLTQTDDLLDDMDSTHDDLESLEQEIENELAGIFADTIEDIDDTKQSNENNASIDSNNEVNISDSENNIETDFLSHDSSSDTQSDILAENPDTTEDSNTQDSKDEATSNQTLSYINTNIAKSRVFKTDPELSKICGKSLKS